MSLELDKETARVSFLASFSTEDQGVGQDLMMLIDDLVSLKEIESGSLDQLIGLDAILKSGPIEGAENTSQLPEALTVEMTRAILDYLRDGHGIVIADNWDLENTDPEILLTDLQPLSDLEPTEEPEPEAMATAVEASPLGEPPPLPDDADDEAQPDEDFDPAAFANVNPLPLAADTDASRGRPAKPDVMERWPHLRDSLSQHFDYLASLYDEQSAITDPVVFEEYGLRIQLCTEEMRQREWFMKRMAGRDNHFTPLFAKGLSFCEARWTNQDHEDPEAFRNHFF